MCRGAAAIVITGKYWSVVLMLCGASVAVAAAQQAATEAPAGFDTPTLVEKPGSRSVSNGIAGPAGDCKNDWPNGAHSPILIPQLK